MNRCLGCPACGTAASSAAPTAAPTADAPTATPTSGLNCRASCDEDHALGKPWDTLCTMNRCLGCPACGTAVSSAAPTAAPTADAPTATPTSGLNCRASCDE